MQEASTSKNVIPGKLNSQKEEEKLEMVEPSAKEGSDSSGEDNLSIDVEEIRMCELQESIT